MNETGHDARGTFLAESGGVPPRTGLPHDAREQGASARRRHRRLRRRLLVPAAAGMAAAGMMAALLAACASHAPSALAAVTSALARTSASSYRFSLDSAVKYRGRETQSDVVSGAYDPRHGLGTELLATRVAQRPVTAQIRFTSTYVYTRVAPGSGLATIGRPWNKAPLPRAGADTMPGYDVYAFVTDRPVTPDELSAVLRSADTVRDQGSASGPGWTGERYAFTARLFDGRESVSGTVYVDQHGHVRRLATISTLGIATTVRDLTFGDFGAPVPVTTPPISQVKYTSSPYWGFYF
jgi:hypothetical protein